MPITLNRRTLLAAGAAALLTRPVFATPGTSGFADALTDDVPAVLDTDLCIVGAGAAGMTLAMQLADAPIRILMLESGGLDIDGQTQGLYRGANTGLPYFDLTACRLRYLGGTTNHWGGYCRPNDPIDYQGRPDLGVPAWPVTAADLAPHINRAAAMLGLTPEGWDPAFQLRARKLPENDLLEAHGDTLMTKVFQISQQVRFRPLYRDRLMAQGNLKLLLHANVTHIGLDPDGRRVERLTVRALNGRTTEVRAKRVVLACHAIENARLLLSSDDVMPTGVGNAHGHVGRHFMEHAHVISGVFIPAKGKFPAIYDSDYMASLNVNANLGLTEAAMRRRGILQYYCRFLVPQENEAVRAAMGRMKDAFWEPFDPAFLDDVAEVMGNLPSAAAAVRDKLTTTRGDARYYLLDHRIEQAPNPASRIELSAERDALGNRRANLHWALNDLDYKTFQQGQAAVAEAMTALGMGEFRLRTLDADEVDRKVRGHFHHIGTTRMSERPEDGVVDANCRVHGLENLYVAGSGVFPTAGYSGPTMMLIALAIRLSTHLKEGTAA
ncbi:choline dehydrogenase-like flavoprotein [Azospirillum fermentarium]|uniref:FAD-dependent oxidoreductase n=1 Tax=Azospirillum fermentarium TaxID=1233114 RepID=UPI002226B2E3|nr:GMC family oxidoreductase [Azospirillum fermentarium]MCW2247463.1 choline dehydrogenase-like flavoprotein [Azospirillum fermentarium]